jgi:putative DNA primase/helicase
VGHHRGNTRNGKGQKTLKGDFGELELETPRDRQASFDPKIDLARGICRLVASEVMDDKSAGLRRQIASAKTVAATVRLAQSDERLAALPETWDRDAYLLATPGGTVELKSGKLRSALPTDFITRVTAVSPAPPSSPVPTLWSRFLKDITLGDTELEGFLRRAAGYSLCADVSEEAFFSCLAAGSTAKRCS